jgi:hypothetical protein
VFYPDKPKTDDSGVRPVVVKPQVSPVDRQEVRVVDPTEAEVRRDLRRSKIRQRIWITMAAAQVGYLLVIVFWR